MLPLICGAFSTSSTTSCLNSVFRAKGVLWFRESNRRHLFHLCGKRFTIDDSDWPEGRERHTRVVAIGKGLDQATLRAQLEACVALP